MDGGQGLVGRSLLKLGRRRTSARSRGEGLEAAGAEARLVGGGAAMRWRRGDEQSKTNGVNGGWGELWRWGIAAAGDRQRRRQGNCTGAGSCGDARVAAAVDGGGPASGLLEGSRARGGEFWRAQRARLRFGKAISMARAAARIGGDREGGSCGANWGSEGGRGGRVES